MGIRSPWSRRTYIFLVRCFVSTALIAFVLWKVDWHALGAVLTHLRPSWAVAGSFLTPLLMISLTLRWGIFLRAQGINLPFFQVLSLTWAGQFFNSVLPGSMGGDVVKIYQICRLAPDRKAGVASTVFVDRLTALFALIVLAVAAFAISPSPLSTLPMQFLPLRTTLLLLLPLVVVGALAGRHFLPVERHSKPGDYILATEGPLIYVAMNRRAPLPVPNPADEVLPYLAAENSMLKMDVLRDQLERNLPKVCFFEGSFRPRQKLWHKLLYDPLLEKYHYIKVDDRLWYLPDARFD